LGAVALKRPEIIAIAERVEQLHEDPPIPLARGDAEVELEVILQILLDPIVVEQRVVDVDEEDDRTTLCHVRKHGVRLSSRGWPSRLEDLSIIVVSFSIAPGPANRHAKHGD